MLQLPIAANLESDYLMGRQLLGHRARRSIAALRRSGDVRPGVHLFTILTHGKFLNARRGDDEFRLDPDSGGWATARRHLAAWRRAGASFVTARQGVEAVIDDRSWNPVPLLSGASFRLARERRPEVTFRLEVLGRGIPVSEDFPQHLLVVVPCSLRRHLESVKIEGNAAELEEGGTTFWLRRSSGEPLSVTFRLRRPYGREPDSTDRWEKVEAGR